LSKMPGGHWSVLDFPRKTLTQQESESHDFRASNKPDG
jgi:hypothetical protein